MNRFAHLNEVRNRYFSSQFFLMVLLVSFFSLTTYSALASSSKQGSTEQRDKPVKTIDQPVKAVDHIVTPKSETRVFRYFVLDNDLKVLLVQDSEAEKSAASLDVEVGAGDDPLDRNGLAHFLEHMLFLGTKKYPEAGAFQAFVSGHGGRHNAYTSLYNTNYFFDIDSQYFKQALDRFAQFFIAPTFDQRYVNRERNAVESEFRAKLLNDYRRVRDIIRELVPSDHALARFTTGNLQTLAMGENNKLVDDLHDFYHRHYSSERMVLTVISPHPLEKTEAWARAMFRDVKKRHLPPHLNDPRSFKDNFLPANLNVASEKKKRQVSFIFPVPSSTPFYAQKPLTYIGHFLGHEGKGSLFSALKHANLATALSAGKGLQWRGGEMFNVTINLTEKGLAYIEDIEAALFHYIDLLKQEGLDAWRFDELKWFGQLDFEYGDSRDPYAEVISLSRRLQNTPVKDVLRKPFLYDVFDSKLIADYLSYLSPKNRLRIILKNDFKDEDNNEVINKTTNKTRFYQTPYKLESLGPAFNGPVQTDDLVFDLSTLALPEKNRFFPKKFSIKGQRTAEGHKHIPKLINNKFGHEFWYLNDNFTSLPKASVRARYYLPNMTQNAQRQLVAKLYTEMINADLSELYYDANLAGLRVDFDTSSRTIDLTFSGYNDRLDELAEQVIARIKKYNKEPDFRKKIHDKYFELVLSEVKRKHKNRKYSAPYKQLNRALVASLYHPYWTYEQQDAALDKTTRKQYEKIVATLFERFRVESLVFGNVSKREAKRYRKKLLNIGISSRNPGPMRAQLKRLPEHSGLNSIPVRALPVSHDDYAAMLYLQAPDDSPATSAQYLLMNQMLSAPFFHSLRTEQQLGYIVYTSNYPIRSVPGLIALVQSPKSQTQDIMYAIRQFFVENKGLLDNFERDKQSVLKSLEEKPKSQSEFASRLWRSIVLDQKEFNFEQKMIVALTSLSEQAMRAYFEQQTQSAARALWVVTQHQGSERVLPEGVEAIDPGLFKFEGRHQSYP